MVKIALFVEGQTERIFLERLLDNYYTHPDFNVESQEIRGGRAKIITHINYTENNVKYYFLIFDVGGDGKVVSAIYERSKNLVANHAYNHIFGIRDLYPNSKEQLESINNSVSTIFKNDEIVNNVTLVIAIMEVETWFLANHSFFSKINLTLTTQIINETLGIDIEKDDLESYGHPAKMIDDILKLVGKSYKKKESDTHGICACLDFEELCLNVDVRARIKSFDNFLHKLDKCIV